MTQISGRKIQKIINDILLYKIMPFQSKQEIKKKMIMKKKKISTPN